MTPQYSREARLGGILADKVGVQNLIDMYLDRWDYLLEEELAVIYSAETYKSLYWLRTKELNLLKRAINEVSLVYKSAPERRVYTETKSKSDTGEMVETENEIDLYEKIIDERKKNIVMKQVNRYTNLVGHTVIRVRCNGDKLEHELLNFSNVEVYTSRKDWRRVVAIKVYSGIVLPIEYTQSGVNPYKVLAQGEVGGVTAILGGRKTIDYQEAMLWVAGDYSETTGMMEPITNHEDMVMNKSVEKLMPGTVYKIVPDTQNEMIVEEKPIPYTDAKGLPVLPFVIFDKVYPVDTRFNFSSSNDLLDMNLNAAMWLILINQMIKYQSYKQLVITTPDATKLPHPFQTGPHGAVILESDPRGGTDPTASVLDMTMDANQFYDIMTKRILQSLATYNISPQNFQLSGSPASGFSLMVSNLGKLEAREDQIDMYRVGEGELFEVERIVWNTHAEMSGKEILDVKAKFNVDFAEIEFPESSTEWVAKRGFEYTHNVITDADLLREKNPDMDEAQVEETINKNRMANQQSAPRMTLGSLE